MVGKRIRKALGKNPRAVYDGVVLVELVPPLPGSELGEANLVMKDGPAIYLTSVTGLDFENSNPNLIGKLFPGNIIKFRDKDDLPFRVTHLQNGMLRME